MPHGYQFFHLAFHVRDLDVARDFYGRVLGCAEGRSTDTRVPMPHFGLVMALPQWQALAQRLQDAQVECLVPPQVRFEGQPGEQRTLFFTDPFGNPIEFKGNVFRT